MKIQTTNGELLFTSTQTGSFGGWRFGELTLPDGKKIEVALENNKFCGKCTAVGDKSIDALAAAGIEILRPDGKQGGHQPTALWEATKPQ